MSPFLPFEALDSRTEWMLGSTPPLAIVTMQGRHSRQVVPSRGSTSIFVGTNRIRMQTRKSAECTLCALCVSRILTPLQRTAVGATMPKTTFSSLRAMPVNPCGTSGQATTLVYITSRRSHARRAAATTKTVTCGGGASEHAPSMEMMQNMKPSGSTTALGRQTRVSHRVRMRPRHGAGGEEAEGVVAWPSATVSGYPVPTQALERVSTPEIQSCTAQNIFLARPEHQKRCFSKRKTVARHAARAGRHWRARMHSRSRALWGVHLRHS